MIILYVSVFILSVTFIVIILLTFIVTNTYRSNHLMKKMLESMKEWMIDDIRQHDERLVEYKKTRGDENDK